MFLLSAVVFDLPAHAQTAELVVQSGHAHAVASVAFSPDGKILASGSYDNTIKLWDVASGKELRTLSGHSSIVKMVAFSPDGHILASGSSIDTIKLWNVESGKELRTLKGDFWHVHPALFSPDGKMLAFRSSDQTIRLWDVASGKELRTLSGHSKSISSIAFSPDGETLATGSGDSTIKLWEVESGKELRTLLSHASVSSVSFSLNGKTLASGSTDGSIKLWDVEREKELGTLKGHMYRVDFISFSPDGKILASISNDTTYKLWDIESRKELKTFKGYSHSVSPKAFSPSAKILASVSSVSDGVIKLWDINSDKELRTLSGHSVDITSASFTLDGKTLAFGSRDNMVRLWDIENSKDLRALPGHSSHVFSVSLSTDGKTLASGSDDNTVKLWDVKSGKELRTVSGHFDSVMSVAFSPDGKILASGSDDNRVRLWDVESGKALGMFLGGSFSSLSFSPDGKILASADFGGRIVLWDVENGKELKFLYEDFASTKSVSFSPDGKTLAVSSGASINLWDVESGKERRPYLYSPDVYSVSFSPDGKILAAGSRHGTIGLWEVESGKELRIFQGHSNTISSISFSPDGKTFFTASWDRKIKLWDRATGKELCSLIALDKDDWAVVTPDGLFDASPGARKLMHYVVGLEPITLEQMKDVYYVPGLLQEIFRGEPLPTIPLFSKKDLFPQVEYDPLKPNQKQLKIKLTNRGGGIGQVQVLFNGKELIADARPAKFNPRSPNAALTIDLSKASVKRGEENRIEIVARNAAGSLSTRGTDEAEIVYKDESDNLIEPPNIYAIVGGISDYTGDNLTLNFAAKDAEDFAHALELGAIKLLNGDQSKVHIRLLTSNGGKSNIKFNSPDAKTSTATKADFVQAFSDFRNATSKDVFIVYLAGHGISLNLNQNPAQAGGDTYLYLTQEATTTDKSVLVVESSRKAMAISSEELKELMKQNTALKQVLILDTCAAGALSNSLIGKRDLPSDQIRAIERLKDNTGFFVLMGASADAISYEASQYGQGLLTYTLLQGMKGARLRESQFADVAMLFGYAQETVPQMAKNIGGIQQPLIITPDISNSFDIGKFTTEEQKQISLSNPKPLILRPTLLNEKLKFDNLQLTPLLKQAFQNASFGQRSGQAQADLVFIDADEMVDAVIPSGTYELNGEALNVTIILVQNNEPLKSLTFTGNLQEKDSLVKRIVESVSEETAKLRKL